MKIVFLGTPGFAVPFLDALVGDDRIDVVAVVAQPDKPSGRGGALRAPATKIFAESKNIEVLQPASLKSDPNIVDVLNDLNADAFVVVAYGKIIPENILSIPKLGNINVHPSALPLHRGPSPMQWAIAGGDATTGVSIMLLDKGMDTGPILAFESISLDDIETYESLQGKVQTVGPTLLIQTLLRHEAGEITPIEQDDSKATLTHLLKREDGHVDYTQSMVEIERKHRAYSGWPGTWSIWNRNGAEMRIKLLQLNASDFNADLAPGTVRIDNDRMFIDCADGTLEILEVQLEGKPKMKSVDFIRGYQDIDSVILS
jgi:methionyl-tRNA formyltransferase